MWEVRARKVQPVPEVGEAGVISFRGAAGAWDEGGLCKWCGVVCLYRCGGWWENGLRWVGHGLAPWGVQYNTKAWFCTADIRRAVALRCVALRGIRRLASTQSPSSLCFLVKGGEGGNQARASSYCLLMYNLRTLSARPVAILSECLPICALYAVQRPFFHDPRS